MAKKKTVAQLKKLLWKHFTAYIKRRDKNICCTCGRLTEGQNSQGGHYIAKGACGLEYYFHEKNVHCQCSNCNLRLEGNRPAYRAFLLQKYGKEALDDLEQHYGRSPDDSYTWLLEKIEHYKHENQG
jgi:hypothetical protein